MAETRDGKDLNKKFLSYINESLNKILERGKTNSTEFTNESIPLDQSDNQIKAEDREQYDCIIEFKNYLEHKNLVPEETYVIPGIKYHDDEGKGKITTLYIPKADATKIAEKADKYQKELGIILPEQIFQLQNRYKGAKIPGTEITVPEPRLLSETDKEYETRLENHYKNNGVEKETITDTGLRKPYAHEHIKFHDNGQLDEQYISEYYDYYRHTESNHQINSQNQGQSSPHPVATEQPQVIKESEDVAKTPLAQRIGSFFHISGTSIKSQSNHRKLKVLALGAGATIGAIAILTCPAGALAIKLGIGAAVIGGISFGIKKLKKKSDKQKKKLKDILFGKEIEEDLEEEAEETKEGPGKTPAPTQTQSPQPTPPQPATTQSQHEPQQQQSENAGQNNPRNQGQQNQGIPVAELPKAIEDFLIAIGADVTLYEELNSRLTLATQELNALDENSPEYGIKHGEVLTLTQELKKELKRISDYTKKFIGNINIEEEKEEGHTYGSH